MKSQMRSVLRALDAVLRGDLRARELFGHGASIASSRVTRALRERCGPVATILDVGANVGQFALAATTRFPDAAVHSFEPVPDVADTLRRNVQPVRAITVHCAALGAYTGSLRFHRNLFTHLSSALPLDSERIQLYGARGSEEITVPVYRLDELLPTLGVSDPILLKLDVQGFESEVLTGAAGVLAQIPYVVLEVSFRPLYQGQPSFDALHTQLGEHGYRLDGPVGIQEGRTGEIVELDLLYRRSADR
jgi:FkbM family methyltransferase